MKHEEKRGTKDDFKDFDLSNRMYEEYWRKSRVFLDGRGVKFFGFFMVSWVCLLDFQVEALSWQLDI